MALDFDLIVVGAGPGGYVAAIRGAQLGLKTAIVEREALGGVCLNWGCIPTKALLKSAEVFEQLHHLADYGLSAEGATFDFSKVIARSRGVAKQLNQGVAFLMKKHKITVLEGVARLEKGTPAPRVVVESANVAKGYSATSVILATGARAKTLPALGLAPDGERIWTYREAMTPSACPKSLIVVGSGAIGVEFASFYRALGADVTVIEALDRILPVEDEEVSAAARKAFERRGLKFKVSAKVKSLKAAGAGVVVEIDGEGGVETLSAERAIVAIGIEANIEGLGLEGLKVTLDRGHIHVDERFATGEPGLYAIGDLVGAPWLAHKASHEGVRCVEGIAGSAPHGSAHPPIPGCTYSTPQVASIGLTEARAKAEGRSVKIGRFPFRANGKAIAAGDVDGFVKTVFDAATGELLGAHMIGAEVTEMIQGFALAMTCEATEAEIMATVFPHPTMSEAMHEATLDAFGQAIHI